MKQLRFVHARAMFLPSNHLLQLNLQITETEPGFKGNTATNATKPAVVETGATVYVPLFVEQGETIVIDTRTGEYSKRV